jgi:hypothetical protein
MGRKKFRPTPAAGNISDSRDGLANRARALEQSIYQQNPRTANGLNRYRELQVHFGTAAVKSAWEIQ